MKFWMLQVRKSHLCGISAIFSQCYFMSETQELMTVSGFFSRNHFLEGGFTFQWGGLIFKWGEGTPLGASALMGDGVFKKNHAVWGGGGCPPIPPTMGNPLGVPYKAENWHASSHEQYFSKHHFHDICQCVFSSFQPLTTFAKYSILDVWQGSKYASGLLKLICNGSKRVKMGRFIYAKLFKVFTPN